MNNIYKIEKGIVVPDGTTVFEIIGVSQSKTEGLPITKEQSLAYGKLAPGEKSKVHVHPVISHLTWVISGQLTVGMKDKKSSEMYFIEVAPRETVLTEPETFFQLINNSDQVCEVLYMVAPAFIFEVNEQGEILYNDQIVLNLGWKELAERNWQIPELEDIETIRKMRDESLKRIISE